MCGGYGEAPNQYTYFYIVSGRLVHVNPSGVDTTGRRYAGHSGKLLPDVGSTNLAR